ncbi:GbsR/MarR family transcriptional regulator [Streptomyces sp. NPDC056600]|uniref:GbsR/MarR family transcriptional regulator n=1 Tax=Streptomyces sp. NPDC056600 TaxID=3345874 RepID=UPI0036C5D1B0
MTEAGASPKDRDPEAVSRFVELFAGQLTDAGMARMPARVFAALLASDDGVLTSAELGEQLVISPAAVSGAVRYLSQTRLVSREREPGSRRERYRVHNNQWYEAIANREGMLRLWQSALREGITAVSPGSPAEERLRETLEFFEFIEVELTAMMERWREKREAADGVR